MLVICLRQIMTALACISVAINCYNIFALFRENETSTWKDFAVHHKNKTSREGNETAATSTRPQQPQNTTSGLSACLLVNDENLRLPEWIAYHYTVLPLRHLIVAIDPASLTSPRTLLDFWNNNTDLTVTIWNDDDYLAKENRGVLSMNNHTEHERTSRHRTRQNKFIMSCMKAHKQHNRTWVLLTDVDEYVLFNTIHKDDPVILDEAPMGVPTLISWEKNGLEIGGYLKSPVGEAKWQHHGKYVYIYQKKQANVLPRMVVHDKDGSLFYLRDDYAHWEQTALRKAPPGVPTLREFKDTKDGISGYIVGSDKVKDDTWYTLKNSDYEESILHGGHFAYDGSGNKFFLEYHQKHWPKLGSIEAAQKARAALPAVKDGGTIQQVLEESSSTEKGYLGPCLSMPRLFYGSKESSSAHSPPSQPGFNRSKFATLRYGHHARKGKFDLNKYGKTIVDVSKIPFNQLDGGAHNIHRPLKYYCRNDLPRYTTSLFRVNHYLDSFEAYSYRNDARTSQRKDRASHETMSRKAVKGFDRDIEHWLGAFVDLLGQERASKILAGAGEINYFATAQ